MVEQNQKSLVELVEGARLFNPRLEQFAEPTDMRLLCDCYTCQCDSDRCDCVCQSNCCDNSPCYTDPCVSGGDSVYRD